MELLSYTPLLGLLVLPVLAVGLWFSLVDRPKGRRVASWALRALGIVLLVLALCRPFVAGRSDDLHVVFLVDVSESVDLAAAEASLAHVEEAVAALGAGDSWSLFALGEQVRKHESVEALRGVIAQWRNSAADDRFRSGTRLAAALRQVRLAFPGGKAKRLVVLSDGQPTDGEVDDALRVLRDERIEVRLRRIAGLTDPEAAVAAVEPSTRSAFENEIVRLTVRLASNTAMGGELRIIHRGAVVARTDVQLTPDEEHEVQLDVAMTTPGPSVWTAELLPDQDRFPINNQASCTIDVAGQPRLLVLHEKPREMRDFARTMQEQRFVVDVRPPHGLPDTMDRLLAFDAVVLADAPATGMSTRQMLLLNRYVADFAGGLMMLGSENSFGLGGYYKTPVEEVLPLVSRFEKEKEKPSLAMVLVIDKSGSMDGLPIALARQAAKAAVELLSPQDQIGVVAFDSQAYIVSEMRPGTDAPTVKLSIDRLGAGGGTFMYAGMRAASDMLENTPARIKHMIVLGDGQTQPADHLGLVAELVDQHVTVSTVALGAGADQHLLATIAEQGRGRYYQTMDPTTVPQIFTRETMQASRSAIKEDVFASVQVSDHPLLAGFETEPLPFTLGYVMTQPKPTAQVVLATQTGDPLLAVSRFGLGTGMAYTGDLTRRWGGEWLAWRRFGQFCSQLFRALVRKADDRDVLVHQQREADTWRVRIDRRDASGRPIPGIHWDAELIDDQGGRRPVAIEETGLGRYAVDLPLADQRHLTLRLHDTDHGKLKALHYRRPYPAEYRLNRRAPEVLAALPRFEPAAIRAGLEPVARREPVSHYAILAAMACLIAGVVLRRV